MLKQNLLKLTVSAAIITGMLLLSACGGDPTKEEKEPTPTETIAETSDTSAEAPSETEPSEPAPSSEPETEPETDPETTPEAPGNVIAKINGGADDVGIYSVVVRLTDAAADKGTIEMIYHGAKGSPQENSIVNTFLIEYYKEADGTFEVRTFFNGETYQNQHRKEEVKVINTFDATLRAGDVTIFYTPDGGSKQEIFNADAEYFR